MDEGICNGCGAEIYWVVTAKNQARMPLDRKPEQRVIINTDGQAVMIRTYMPHHATCPDVEMFRRQSG